MILFLLASLLTVGVIAALVAPLLRPHLPPPPAERFNAAVYRQQLAELDADLGRESLPQGEAAGARVEIERRLLAASRRHGAAETEAAPEPTRAPAWTGVAIAVALILLGGGLYLFVGKPGLPDQPFMGDRRAAMTPAAAPTAAATAPGQAAPQAEGQGEFERLIAQLQAKMAANPGDAKGWLLLARGLMRLDRPGEAVEAYGHVLNLAGDQAGPVILSEATEARVAAAGGQVDQQAVAAFRKVAAADPAAPQPKYYLALAKAQAGDRAGALADWKALAASAPADAPYLPPVRARIAEIERPAAASGPTGEQMAAAGALPQADQRAMIDAMVSRLADRLKANPDDADGWRRLARAYTVLGKQSDANTAWRQVLRLAPGDADARSALSR